MEVSGGWRKTAWEITKTVVISLAIVIPIRVWIAQPFVVRGASMEPNYYSGDYLIIDEVSPRFFEFERGETIVLRYPLQPKQFFIKRIIGLSGETVLINAHGVSIYNEKHPEGFVLDEPYLDADAVLVTAAGIPMRLELSENEYFVLGDNRGASSDSRAWGALHEKLIIGRPFVRLWPFNEIGLIR